MFASHADASVFGLKRGMILEEIKALNLGEVNPAPRIKAIDHCDGDSRHEEIPPNHAAQDSLEDCRDRFVIRNINFTNGAAVLNLSVPPGLGLLEIQIWWTEEVRSVEDLREKSEGFLGLVEIFQRKYGQSNVIYLQPEMETARYLPWQWSQWMVEKEPLLSWYAFEKDGGFHYPEMKDINSVNISMDGWGPGRVAFWITYALKGYDACKEVKYGIFK